ncbi:MAG: glutamine--fructose-6-phosphate transaminase (isomerizing) [Candidatus Margulisbacteria bacterium]|nr:glutamine--fructose-6-phosphate transaminase (isomerizing) [Candidatus Margulisiibacteriota bacterium]
MCGIVGYTGPRGMETILLVGLERLSYRGYDSSGIATIYNGELSTWKKPGKIRELEATLKNFTIKGHVGIGHTRWATHGEPNELNAHPHLGNEGKVAAVHNGIIENYTHIKQKLSEKGHIFRSVSDSEVIPHLIETYLNGSLESAVEKTVKELEGSFAIAVISESDPDKIVVYRKGSPLIIGVGKGENFISSDVNALMPHTKEVIYLDDDEMAIISKENVIIKKSGNIVQKKVNHISWDAAQAEKSGYDHYMLKEIHEQATVSRQIIAKSISKQNKVGFKHVESSMTYLEKVNRFIIQACGTSWHSGLVGKYWLEQYARIPTEVDISSEFRYRHMISRENEIIIALSQSGETADTLACIREAKSKFFNVLSFVNSKGSTMDRESDGVIYTHSGPEIGVASTKNYIAQLISLYLFTIFIGRLKGTLSEEKADKMIQSVKKIPEYIDSILGNTDAIKTIADKYYLSREFVFIGRGVNYPTALEGALKLKEISYIHATGYPAGELKHGPIALIDAKLPVVCIAPQSDTYNKMIANIEEVKARKGKTIIIATEGDTQIQSLADDIIYIPSFCHDLTPILSVIPLQLFAYYIAIKLDCDVDQPRNLAKSVTVE